MLCDLGQFFCSFWDLIYSGVRIRFLGVFWKFAELKRRDRRCEYGILSSVDPHPPLARGKLDKSGVPIPSSALLWVHYLCPLFNISVFILQSKLLLGYFSFVVTQLFSPVYLAFMEISLHLSDKTLNGDISDLFIRWEELLRTQGLLRTRKCSYVCSS